VLTVHRDKYSNGGERTKPSTHTTCDTDTAAATATAPHKPQSSRLAAQLQKQTKNKRKHKHKSQREYSRQSRELDCCPAVRAAIVAQRRVSFTRAVLCRSRTAAMVSASVVAHPCAPLVGGCHPRPLARNATQRPAPVLVRLVDARVRSHCPTARAVCESPPVLANLKGRACTVVCGTRCAHTPRAAVRAKNMLGGGPAELSRRRRRVTRRPRRRQ